MPRCHHGKRYVSNGKEAEKVVDPIITVILFFGTCYLLGEVFYGS